jgi:hypothetical protein
VVASGNRLLLEDDVGRERVDGGVDHGGRDADAPGLAETLGAEWGAGLKAHAAAVPLAAFFAP